LLGEFITNSSFPSAFESLAQLCVFENQVTLDPTAPLDRKTFIVWLVKTFERTNTTQFQTNLTSAPVFKDINNPEMQLVFTKARILGRLNGRTAPGSATSLTIQPDKTLTKQDLTDLLKTIPD
jgi:hypothetical protein